MEAISSSLKAYEAIHKALTNHQLIAIHPQGTSMFPLLKEGRDSVIAAPLEKHAPGINDIILYRRDNGLLVLHRLCKIKKDGYYFVGDNQTEKEGPLRREQLLAYVIQITRNGHTFSTKHPIYAVVSRIWLLLRPVRHKISRPAKKLLLFLHLWQEDFYE